MITFHSQQFSLPNGKTYLFILQTVNKIRKVNEIQNCVNFNIQPFASFFASNAFGQFDHTLLEAHHSQFTHLFMQVIYLFSIIWCCKWKCQYLFSEEKTKMLNVFLLLLLLLISWLWLHEKNFGQHELNIRMLPWKIQIFFFFFSFSQKMKSKILFAVSI